MEGDWKTKEEYLKSNRVKKDLIAVMKQIVEDKSLGYEFKHYKEGEMVIEECKRLLIGQVSRGNFSQLIGRGVGFGFIRQPDEDVDIFQVIKN